MVLIAICGIPGAGKSTVGARLKALGHDAWGTDEDGLSGWRDCVTKESVTAPTDWHDLQATAGIEYATRRQDVAALRSYAEGVDHPVYLYGPAGGEHEFWDLFDRAVQLEVDNATLADRLQHRTGNSYGKAAHERESILEANQGWVTSWYRNRGAVVIDATQPLDAVVAAVVAAAHG